MCSPSMITMESIFRIHGVPGTTHRLWQSLQGFGAPIEAGQVSGSSPTCDDGAWRESGAAEAAELAGASQGAGAADLVLK